MKLIDTHAHLDFKEYDQDVEEVIKRAEEHGVIKIINIGSTVKASKKALDIANKYEQVYTAIGIHPEEVLEVNDDNLNLFREMCVFPAQARFPLHFYQ